MQTPKVMNIESLLSQIKGLPVADSLSAVISHFTSPAFSTSFSIEDQMITHLIHQWKLPVRIFTLDTGRHFSETYRVWDETCVKYNLKIESFNPESKTVESLLNQKGPYSFYESVDNRKECCHIRKVLPLQRALVGTDLWITGIRAEHSVTRTDLPMLEYDTAHNIIKFHPLLPKSHEEVWSFIAEHKIPYNKLYDTGFLSIGCEPCTRAVKAGESLRSGRWWWENPETKECGLHVRKK